ncbi:nucleoporin NUP188 homolog, partial [Notothenia coriiceps]|uniref:Nucleoporin NUP188 homolog n=1 Tax=Notothenia coriiceps TaxID=8208 RepID=A0A6I9NI41_9TELE
MEVETFCFGELKLPEAKHQPQHLKDLERIFREKSTNILPEMCTDLETSVTAITAKMCIYGLLSFVVTSFEEESLQTGGQAAQCSHLIDAACEVLSAPNLAEVFWEMKPNMGLGMILDSAVGMFPHKIGPLLQLLTALLSNKSTVKKV